MSEPKVKGSAPLAVERDGKLLWLKLGGLLDGSLTYEAQPELERIYRDAEQRAARLADATMRMIEHDNATPSR